VFVDAVEFFIFQPLLERVQKLYVIARRVPTRL
jgi:hypothetical protein